MYKKGTGNDKQGKDAGNRTLCPYRNFSQAIMFHVNQAVVVDHFQRVVVAFDDTDVFVCLMYHFSHWMDFDLKEL